MAGFEPATPRIRTEYSDQTELHPVAAPGGCRPSRAILHVQREVKQTRLAG